MKTQRRIERKISELKDELVNTKDPYLNLNLVMSMITALEWALEDNSETI